ncbi:class I glutamine amidotransferase-like protein [Podospora fimiseda]|uniref:Class I glutamine amidotransferase-like protein n=1 Tax=Podospora fimiseda TaxID=252190 RepID=A0AAN7BKR8_9PEZI|nr:class I glutamine amidotransferase-like protein [Podospora fimiseda]
MTITTHHHHQPSRLGLSPPPKLKIAILLNSYRSPFIAEIRDSYTRSIGAVSPESHLSFFYPADHYGNDSLAFPDPELFDLIVVGGGNADPRKKHAWILRVHKFILDVVAHHPRKKIVGICWGHQTISMLFGGEIVDMDVPELGVTESKLTPSGTQFFSAIGQGGILRLQQHHRRAVGTPPRGFHELLAGNQSFLSHNNSILTFQGHPEKDARCAKLRIGDAMRWFGVELGDHAAMGRIQRDMERQHDGHEVWGRVLEWVREKGSGVGMMDHHSVHGGGMHL